MCNTTKLTVSPSGRGQQLGECICAAPCQRPCCQTSCQASFIINPANKNKIITAPPPQAPPHHTPPIFTQTCTLLACKTPAAYLKPQNFNSPPLPSLFPARLSVIICKLLIRQEAACLHDAAAHIAPSHKTNLTAPVRRTVQLARLIRRMSAIPFSLPLPAA